MPFSFTFEGRENCNTSVTTFIHNLSFFQKVLDKQPKICNAALEYAEKLNYISSSGLRVILRLRKQEGALKLINVSSEVSDAGLYVAEWKDLERLAEIAMEAYRDYPLHNWFTNGRYDCEASKRIMEVSLRTMVKDGVIYADSPQMNGFAA